MSAGERTCGRAKGAMGAIAAALALFCAGSRLDGRGDGTLKAPLVLTAPDPLSLAAGDFNGDGRQDLAAVNGTSQITSRITIRIACIIMHGKIIRMVPGNFKDCAIPIRIGGHLVMRRPA